METSPWRAPLLWRVLIAVARLIVVPVCRLRVRNAMPADLRDGPVILAANHVSPFDPLVLIAASHVAGITPRVMATGGVFDVPVLGWIMRRCGHIRVDRHTVHAANALQTAGEALARSAMVLVYPEGRIGLDPWMWPERGKTGVARMAELSGAPVLPVAQWGAHAVLPYVAPRRTVWPLLRALLRRPVVQVRFGAPVDLSAVHGPPGARAVQATRLIMAGIDEALAPLRATEMRSPHYVDRTRPMDMSRVRPRD